MSFSDHEVHAVVSALHEAMGFREPPFSMSSLIETMFPEVDVVARRMDAHASIDVYPTPLADGVQAVIAYNENDHHSTQRFSIGHELAHWLIDVERGTRLEGAVCRHGGRRQMPERRADYFAAELLAPLWVLDQFVDFEIYPKDDDEDAISRRNQRIQRLASKFNVSLRCMRNRVFSLHAWRRIIR